MGSLVELALNELDLAIERLASQKRDFEKVREVLNVGDRVPEGELPKAIIEKIEETETEILILMSEKYGVDPQTALD